VGGKGTKKLRELVSLEGKRGTGQGKKKEKL